MKCHENLLKVLCIFVYGLFQVIWLWAWPPCNTIKMGYKEWVPRYFCLPLTSSPPLFLPPLLSVSIQYLHNTPPPSPKGYIRLYLLLQTNVTYKTLAPVTWASISSLFHVINIPTSKHALSKIAEPNDEPNQKRDLINSHLRTNYIKGLSHEI